ncbi:tripartite tricarboxylate transporter substrate-binding protein [Bradyrhizobium sp. JYMT SZCCT0180]|uniref:tripartite tricarboxylate transporter substrate-binding protein n=1 Tax=Bradyrhizobium sp. JYMT SZCCT0180 TaxID=2807666 RepID=UPI001BA74CFE|nr:tripartite tricarboxylate transporter substrate-binding protein [Bradyrhizobium sp. JYMT SZCCT0180]MBR1209036.1 tripartite tricarboxylate transporter substrate binding protein BugD [Bradyrhizobium sp. JYMT SZCCT0180]
MRFNRRTILSGALAAASLWASHPAFGQTAFPTKPITIIVPAAAGGPTDTVARLIAESMGRSLGQTILVENIGGAGGTLGMARVSKSAADGYTLAIWHIAHATAPALYDSLKYDVVDDFDHLGRITDVPMTLVSKPTLAANNVTEYVAWIRASGEKAVYGHAGIGSASHLCMLMLMKELGVQMNGIPYRGTGPAMNDLLSGQFDVMCDQTTNTTNQIKEGKIKGFAVTTKAKVSSLPDLPTLDSGAVKGFEASAWHALWAPKGLPKDATDKLVAALQAALKDPKVIERFANLGTEPVAAELATPAALKAHLTAEVPRWGAVIKAAGAKGN